MFKSLDDETLYERELREQVEAKENFIGIMRGYVREKDGENKQLRKQQTNQQKEIDKLKKQRSYLVRKNLLLEKQMRWTGKTL